MIKTDASSAKHRARMIDVANRRLLITNFVGSEQEHDLTEPPNCDGFGRIRHFHRRSGEGWISNPLPIDPACRALNLPPTDMLRAQIFQNAGCNWRCWYCFVPFNLLAADIRYADWRTPTQLVDAYLAQPNPPQMIDLTGGQPDLTPEWVIWMMDELEARGIHDQIYLWSDDNLSTDYLWQFLSDADLARMAAYPKYGRVACFKGFDTASFAFNTQAEPEQFDSQFTLMDRLLALGIDVYAYATFTTPRAEGISDAMARFVERLQKLDENLPLRTIPLHVRLFTPVTARLREPMTAALNNQDRALEAWQLELERRYSGNLRAQLITDISLHRRSASREPRAQAL